MNEEILTLIEKFWDQSIAEDEMLKLRNLILTDPEVAENIAEELCFKGLILSSSTPDLYCEDLAGKIDLAIGASGPPGSFEDRVIKLISETEQNKPKAERPKLLTAKNNPGLLNTRHVQQKFIPKKSKAAVFLSLAAVASILILVGLLLYMNGQSNQTPVIAEISQYSKETSHIRKGKRQVIAEDALLREGDRLVAGLAEEVSIKYLNEDTVITLASGADVVFTIIEGAKCIELKKGEVNCIVAKQAVNNPVRLRTSQATIVVLGTEFKLFSSKGETTLDVTEGTVSVSSIKTHKEKKITKGERIRIDEAGEIVYENVIRPFEEKNGLLVVEAEAFHSAYRNGSVHWWQVNSLKDEAPKAKDPDVNHAESASGQQYIELLPDLRLKQEDLIVPGQGLLMTPKQGPALTYRVYFNTPGRYTLWVRGYPISGEDNSVFVDVEGEGYSNSVTLYWNVLDKGWQWSTFIRNGSRVGEKMGPKASFTIPRAGYYDVVFSMREDGTEIDKWLLSSDPTYSPKALGPASSSVKK